MKLSILSALVLLAVSLNPSPTKAAFTRDAIEVSNISAMDVETSYGYSTVSLKAEVCNNEAPAKIFMTMKGKNWNGNELADVQFDSMVLDQGECRTVTETKMIKTNIRNDIREWQVKSIRRYRP